jgi:hypothetical protein
MITAIMQHGRRLVLAAAASVLLADAGSAQTVEPAAIFLTWSSDPTTAVTIDWHLLPGNDIATVELRGPGLDSWASFRGHPVRFPFSERTVRRAAVDGLRPDTEYELRIGGSRSYRYRTMPARLTRPVRFAAGGDTRAALSEFGRMNRIAAARDVDFVMFGGDLAYSNGDPRLVEREQEWWETVTRTLVTANGRLIPVLPAIGNHEVFSRRDDPALDSVIAEYGVRPGEAPYYSALVATLPNRSYGAIDVGDYLSLLLLDTGHRSAVAGEQTEWLARALKERAHVPFIAPIYHVPGYPSVRTYEGATSGLVRQHWVPLFEQNGVRVAFENHDHVYKRTVPLRNGKRDESGVVYMGDGAWGAGPREVGRDQDTVAWYMEVAKPENHGIFVTIDGSTQRMEVVDTLGRVIDEYRTHARRVATAGTRIVPAERGALASVLAQALPGDTVLLEPGVHAGGILLERRDVTIASRYLVTADTSFIRRTVIDGDSGEYVLRITGTAPRMLSIIGVTLQNAEDCIYAQGRFHFVRSIITRCTDGIDYDRTSGGTVVESLFELNRDDGIDLDQDVDIVIRESVIRANRQDGIEIRLHPHDGDVARATIVDNTISGNGQDGIQFIDYDGIAQREYVVAGNRFIGNGMAAIGCLDRAQTGEDYRSATVHEWIELRANTFEGNGREVSCDLSSVIAAHSPRTATLDPAFVTRRDSAANLDSPAVWHGRNGEHWLLTSAKEGNFIRIDDARTGRFIRDFGTSGKGRGELGRPNGIAVIDDLVFIVERDNARVQVVSLPALEAVGTLGEGLLQVPYGIAVQRMGPAQYQLLVSDNFEIGDAPARDSVWTRRVLMFNVDVHAGVRVRSSKPIADARGAGRLHVVESLAWDPAYERIFAAEEQEGNSSVKIFTQEMRYSGEIRSLFFPHQAEGIALYPCTARSGYWVMTDQGEQVNTFHVFDRGTLRHVGSFRLRGVLNTDGITVTAAPLGTFARGAFFAVHDDGSVAGIGWESIARALELRCD